MIGIVFGCTALFFIILNFIGYYSKPINKLTQILDLLNLCVISNKKIDTLNLRSLIKNYEAENSPALPNKKYYQDEKLLSKFADRIINTLSLF